MRRQLAVLASKLRDPELAFLFNPEEWRPRLDGSVTKDLDALLLDWIGGPDPITILDLSGVRPTILNRLIGALLRILYDALFWARKLPEGGYHRPVMLVLEEAHTYLGKETQWDSCQRSATYCEGRAKVWRGRNDSESASIRD